jgi:DNA-binding MarR family transcriptional regulator
MTTPSRRSATTRRPRASAAAPSSAAGASLDKQPAPEARALLDALQAVARELRLTERRGRAPMGLPPAQLRALRELVARPAASLAELAERTYTDPSSASVVVQRLVERGLVMRVDAEQDRRRTELRATAAGRALVARSPADAVARVADALSPMGERQAASLSRALLALARGLRTGQDGSGEGAVAADG